MLLGPEKANEEKVPVPGCSISPVLVKCDKGAEAKSKITKTKLVQSDRMRGPESAGPSLPLELNKRSKSKPKGKNLGWQNWVQQLLTRDKGKPETRSPTSREINGKKKTTCHHIMKSEVMASCLRELICKTLCLSVQ